MNVCTLFIYLCASGVCAHVHADTCLHGEARDNRYPALSTVLLWAWRWTSALASCTHKQTQVYVDVGNLSSGFEATSPARVFKFLNIDYDVICEQRPFGFLLSKPCVLHLHLLSWCTELATVPRGCWMWVARNIPCSLAEGRPSAREPLRWWLAIRVQSLTVRKLRSSQTIPDTLRVFQVINAWLVL